MSRRTGQDGYIEASGNWWVVRWWMAPSRNRKPEGSTLNRYLRNLRKDCDGPVAGQAVLTAEIRIDAAEDLWTDLDRVVAQLAESSVSPDKQRQFGFQVSEYATQIGS